MRDALFRADGNNRFGFGIELHAPTPLIPLTDGAAQPRNTARYRIAVGVGTLHCLHQFIDDVPRRWAVWIAHAEVDDVLPAPASGHLELGGNVEDVGGQALDARELRFGGGSHAGLSA